MGIDLAHHHVKSGKRRVPVTKNVSLRLLFRLYQFLSQRTESKFNATILHRLCMSRTNTPPVSVSFIANSLQKSPDRIAVVVGKVMNDERMVNLPKMIVAALRFSKSARIRITNAGGEAMTLDQLAQRSPLGSNTLLLRGRITARKAFKHFGVPGAKGSKTKPYVRSKGPKFEKKRR